MAEDSKPRKWEAWVSYKYYHCGGCRGHDGYDPYMVEAASAEQAVKEASTALRKDEVHRGQRLVLGRVHVEDDPARWTANKGS